MIVETVVDWFFALFSTLFAGLESVGLPLQFIDTLQTILVYGTWVVGADIMALFTGMIVFWWIVKFTIGSVIFVWELLPLT